jgi:hypothetical protein
MIEFFDLFERRSDGTLTHRGVIEGLDNACVRVRLLADETDHACFAICAETRELVALVVPAATETALQ